MSSPRESVNSAGVATEPSVGWQLLNWAELDEAARNAVLARPLPELDQSLSAAVAEIIAAVAERGDAALIDFAQRFDGCQLDQLGVSAAQWQAVDEARYAPVLNALEQAAERLRHFHQAGLPQPYAVETAPGVHCRAEYRPLQRVGLYIPAGSAPLISTLAMLVVPALLAGCEEIILCSPPQADGQCHPLVMAAARRLGVRRLFRAGGAQAVAAMALGTASIPRCDKIFGPGNRWVTEAKRQVASAPQGCAIDMPAGPSEVLVIADAAADANKVALDLLSQAEHGPDSQVILLSPSTALLEQVEQALKAWLAQLPRADTARQALGHSRAILTRDLDEAISISNRYAPEHLILQCTDAATLCAQVHNAGSVFVGEWTPESLGDYCSGTNHVLPTGGWARSHSGLSVLDFMKRISFQTASASGLAQLGPIAETLAASEGLDAHRLAVSYRLGKTQP